MSVYFDKNERRKLKKKKIREKKSENLNKTLKLLENLGGPGFGQPFLTGTNFVFGSESLEEWLP